MDLQDFEAQLLYFDLKIPSEIERLLRFASEEYANGGAEQYLLQAYSLAPKDLSVLVALYRFYYYQHRYEDALITAFRAMAIVAPQINFPERWESLCTGDLANGLMKSFTMVRFYLIALKGAAYLNLRMGLINEGVTMLNKVVELDVNDRLGAKALLQSIGPALITPPAVAAFH